MKKINVYLTVEEINDILTVLGKLPYAEVFQLIGNIQQQATSQLQDMQGNSQTETQAVKKVVKKAALVEN